MLKSLKSKLVAVFVSAAMLAAMVPSMGAFAEVPVSNADDYFKNLPAITKDIRFNQSDEMLGELTGCTYGIGALTNTGQTDAGAYKVKIESEAGKILRFRTLADPDNASRTYFLRLNFGLYDGEKEVTSYYGTGNSYSYAADINLNFANKSDGTMSSVNNSGIDSRAYFILQGYGSAQIFLYQDGWKYNGSKAGVFTDLTDKKLENGSYTAVYTITMGSDLASSKGSWKLLKKDENGKVTQIIPLSQNIALAATGKETWDIYNTYGIRLGLNVPYKDSYIEMSGARFYKESITEDAAELLAGLPTYTGNPIQSNNNVNLPGRLVYGTDNNQHTGSTYTTTPGKINVSTNYGSWVDNSKHRNHLNGVHFYFDEVAPASNAGTYVYETDITTHNLGALETVEGTDTKYMSSVDAPSGNRGRWLLFDKIGVNIYKDGFGDNDGKAKPKSVDGIGDANLKLIAVLNIGSDITKSNVSIYYKKDNDEIKFAYSRVIDLTGVTSISKSSIGLCAPIAKEDKPVSIDITGAKFYKKELSNSLTFDSASYKQETGKVIVTAQYGFTKASDTTYTVAAAIYDNATGELNAAAAQPLAIDSSAYIEGTKTVDLALDYSGDMTGKSVKLFTWKVSAMQPVCAVQPVAAAQ